MPNFTLSEIATIALVILIVFGPQRLPEMAQKAGELVRKGRTLVSDLRREFEGEWSEVSQPLKEITKEVQGIKEDMGTSMASLSDEVAKAKEDMEAKLAETKKEAESQVEETNQAIKEVMAEPETEAEEGALADDAVEPGDKP